MNQQAAPEKRKSRAVSVGVVTLCYLLGGMMLLGTVLGLGEMVWYSLQNGPVVPHPDANSRWNEVAITPLNLLSCALQLAWGDTMWMVAGGIWNRNRRLALVAFIVVVACSVGMAALTPYAHQNSFNDPFRSTNHG